MARNRKNHKPRQPIVTPRMHSDMNRALWECCTNSGFTVEDFYSYMRHRDVLQWRVLVAVYLRKIGYSMPEIAAMFRKKTHTGIHDMLRRGQEQGLLPAGWGRTGWKLEKTNAA